MTKPNKNIILSRQQHTLPPTIQRCLTDDTKQTEHRQQQQQQHKRRIKNDN